MALTEFFLTHGAAANDLNGGGPSLGADDGPVQTSANVDSDVAGTTLTDNSNAWSGSSVGDWLTFDTAGSQDRARIVSIDGSDAVVTPAVTGSQSGKSIRVGGAFATVDGALSVLQRTMTDVDGNPPRLNIKADASYTGDAVCDYDGNEDAPIFVRGYTNTPGDGGEAELQLMLDVNGKDHIWLQDLYVNRAAIGDEHAIYDLGTGCILYGVRAKSSGAGKYAIHCSGTAVSIIGGAVEGAGDHGIRLYSGGLVMGTRITDAGNCGISMTYSGVILDCLIDGAYANGIQINAFNGPHHIIRCTIRGVGGSGINRLVATSGYPLIAVNNLLHSCGAYGIEQDTADQGVFLRNAFWQCSSGQASNVIAGNVIDSVTLAGDPLVDASGGDLRIDPRKAAGRQLLAIGFPEQFNATMLNRLDIGALQANLVAGRGILTGGGM